MKAHLQKASPSTVCMIVNRKRRGSIDGLSYATTALSFSGIRLGIWCGGFKKGTVVDQNKMRYTRNENNLHRRVYYE